jgi:hypothetical protein
MTGLEIIGAVVGVASAGISAMGQMQAAKAQSQAATYNAQVAARNRQLALNQAAAEKDDVGRSNQRQLAAIHALYGSSGFNAGAGSALDSMADSSAEGELNVARVGYKGQIKGLELTDQESQYTATAANANTAGTIGAMGAVLGGGTKILSGFTKSDSLKAA